MKHVSLSIALLLCTQIMSATETAPCNTHHSALKHIFTKSALMAKAKDSCATIESAEAYLETGTSVDAEDKDGNTPLMLATINNNTKFVEFFISKGADIEHKNKEGKTALILAAKHKALDAAKILLEHQANINAQDNAKNNALFQAIITNNAAMVELLLEHKADLYQKNHKRSPLFTASSGALPIVKILVTHHALHATQTENNTNLPFIDDGDSTNASPLFIAAAWDHYDTVDYLLKQGANVNHISKNGFTVLHYWACLAGTENIFELLLANGADIDAQDNDGHTPLMIAVQKKQEQSASLLINHGADTDITCNNGHTWRQHTRNKDFRDTIEDFIEEYQTRHREL